MLGGVGYAGNKDKGHVRQLVLFLGIGCSCVLAQAGARAQPMNDPMQPPGASRGAASAAPATPSGGGLRVVITSPNRNLAVIDGVVVPLGAPENGARDAWLKHPGIDKKPARRERP